MNQPQRKRPKQRRTAQPQRLNQVDIWRSSQPLPDVEPITVADDVGALLRSLGDPPIANGVIASHYFTAVIERAAAVAAALALSAHLLAQPTDDQDRQSDE